MTDPPYTNADLDLAEAAVAEALGTHDGNRTVGRHVLDALAGARRLRMTAAELDVLTRNAYEDGKGDGRAEGRRQATEGWERQVAIEMVGGPPYQVDDEDHAQWHVRRGYTTGVLYRLVGPWEPAEPAAPVSHARGCVCGWNDAGQRFDDPICRRR